MKNKTVLLIIFFIFCIALYPNNAHALTSSQYKNRHNCAKFELAGAHTDGSAVKVACYNTFSEAHNAMVSNGAADLIVFDETGTTKIVDAQNALVDVMKTTVYLYENANLSTRQYTSISGLASMGCADGAFISTNASNYAAKVKFNGFTSWISSSDIEIVPVNWLKTKNYYTVGSDYIKHFHTSNIQSTSANISANLLGPKPVMLSAGTYYSYDGNYFYTSLEKMLTDYKKGNYNNSVNKNNPYYNYYQYLSVHSKTTYSSINIDDYVRNVLGYTKSIYGYKAADGASALSGQGTYFYNSQQVYGVNALISFSLGRNESGNGRSSIAITKNNGFGLNAVDSNPSEAANFFPTFASSIYELSSLWLTYGMAYATDWRYFGPALGNKMNGINVKYATDSYWSEKMASNYYYFDKYYGLNDYNYYQLGITNKVTAAYLNASTSKKIYDYPEYGDQLLIVGESGNYYKVMSDININSSGTAVGSKSNYKTNYNWTTSYVYVPKSSVTLINKAKNGYKDPSSVTNYKDANYKYDLYVENATLKPRVGKLTANTTYYHDSTLTQNTGKKVLKDKLVMVYSTAYNASGQAVAYLITSDYFQNQKKWVSANSISFVSSSYGLQTVNVNGTYEWVCSSPIDNSKYKISGFYGGTYFPIVGEEGNWYKVPVSLDSNSNSYGYVLKTESGAHVDKYTYKSSNNYPVIVASDKTIKQGTSISLKDNVTATDQEDGTITSKLTVSGTVDTKTPGTYKVTYSVTDSGNLTTTKTITVTVIKDEEPVITATDKEITINTSFNAKDGVSAKDSEDGNLTSKVTVKANTVNTKAIGTYKVIYAVSDSYGHTVTKEIKVNVVKDSDPVINASDKTISLNSKFDPKDNVTAKDQEDGDLTKSIKVTGSVDTSKLGTYKLTYSVTDATGNKVSKTISVEVVEKALTEKEGNFYFSYLKESNKKLLLQGYQTIIGINNNLNNVIKYKVILENIDTGNKTIFDAERITKSSDIPKKVYSPDGKDYTYSWFNAEIDIDKLSLGNYKMYIEAESSDYYSKSLIANKVYNTQATMVKGNKNSATISNNYNSSQSYVELRIRDEAIINKNSSYVYNQYEKYTKFEFSGDKLHLRGNSYSYGMDLSITKTVKRSIIFENKNTYKTYKKDLGSITNGNYKVVLPVDDKLDKTRAWYDANIDISDIPKGEYVIYISTESNINDVSEMQEKLSRSLASVTKTINSKNYSFTINKERGNRIEMIVK